MGDSYYRYGAPADRGSVPRPSFPGYLFSEPGPSLASPHILGSSDFWSSSSDFLHKDYQINQLGIGVRPESFLGGSSAGASIGYLSVEDPNLLSQRRDVALGITPGIPDTHIEGPSSLRNVDGLPGPLGESNVLFVDGLPTDCTRREVGHLFRPFIGFKEIKVVHKEPRRSGDRALVLCFVEFVESNCALTAMEALQGYKFDDKKPDSPALRIQFAHFPFRPPSDRDEKRIGILH